MFPNLPLIRANLLAQSRPRGLCRVWTGGLTGGVPGRRRPCYGRVSVGGGHRVLAHRAALALETGEAPRDLEAAHRCGNPRCIEPAHLYWATRSQNTCDMVAHGVQATGPTLRHDQVQTVRRLAHLGVPVQELARAFRRNVQTVRKIVAGQLYGAGWEAATKRRIHAA